MSSDLGERFRWGFEGVKSEIVVEDGGLVFEDEEAGARESVERESVER